MDCAALTNANCTAFAPSLTLRRSGGELSMREYRVYSVDEAGRISGERTIDAANDDEAVFAVRSMQRALNTEIWYRDRRIARVPSHAS